MSRGALWRGVGANEFNHMGIESCVLGIGAEHCHSVRERIATTELVRLADWVLGILRVVEARG